MEDLHASFKMVDTCAAEFAAKTPYFYSTYDEDNEAAGFIAEHSDEKRKKVLVFGSGPIRIGQGIEFDYCSVHAVWTLKKHGCEAILINNNPETVSTDFDTGDRLYFDPLNPESVDNIIATEKPDACLVQFGGQTAIKLANHMDEIGLPILGTPADAIDEAEDRERFDELLERCGIPRPEGRTVYTLEQALKAAEEVGYPVLMRPSYVLGGQNMIVAYNSADVVEYMGVITAHVDMSHPVLMDKYIYGTECEVDAICDGEDYLVPGIMEQIERTGVHSGDSICVYPPYDFPQSVIDTLVDYTAGLRGSSRSSALSTCSMRCRTARCMSLRSTPLFPHRAVHQQGYRRADGRSGRALHAGRKAPGYGLWHRAVARRPEPVLRGQGAGLQLPQAARRRYDARPRDEIDRRGAWHCAHLP